MWVYMFNKVTWEYEVGFFRSDTAWEVISSSAFEEVARQLVNYLNGGSGQPQGTVSVQVLEP
jgi:hypothetical protein